MTPEQDGKTETGLSYKQVVSNQEAFLYLRKAELNRLRGIPSEDEKTQPGSEDSTNLGWLEMESTHEFSISGSESSSLPSAPQGAFHFHDSIEAIREEAARIDTIMALDQLDTIKQELGSVKKILEARRMEVHELREQLSLRDDLLSTLELERDLYKAEAAKLKDQVEVLQQNSSLVTEESEPTTVHVTAIRGIDKSEPVVMVPEVQSPHLIASQSDELATSMIEARPPTSPHSGYRTMFRDYTIDEQIVNEIKGKEEGRSCLFAPRHLFRKKRRPESRDENIRELGRLLRASMDSNEELRKRIALLSAYYETVVERMQGSLNEAHTDRQRVATNLAKQIVVMDSDHRQTIEDMDRRLQQKERELAILRETQN